MTGKQLQIALAAALSLGAMTASALAQSASCQRLEAQLTSIDRGPADPGRADQVRRYEEAANKQQFELDRLVAQSRKQGCEKSGFFSVFGSSVFGGPPAQCNGLDAQIQKMRANLDRMLNELQQMQGGSIQRGEQRRSIMSALAENNCGPQYRNAALSQRQGGFFETLFGGSVFNPSETQTSGFRTLCVRTCDGYYFPISFATTSNRFRDDDRVCQRMCPSAEVALYTHRNPGEEVAQAQSLNGRLYSELPTAFRYRQTFDSSCSCRKAGQSWAEALKSLDDTTIEQGDVVVTEDRAKKLSQPTRDAQGKLIRPDPRAGKADPRATATAAADTPAEIEAVKRPVRTVGPTFLPVR
ncbi:MAG: DUF2865 domain-containing protein [Hyphomicrobiales bacterium]